MGSCKVLCPVARRPGCRAAGLPGCSEDWQNIGFCSAPDPYGILEIPGGVLWRLPWEVLCGIAQIPWGSLALHDCFGKSCRVLVGFRREISQSQLEGCWPLPGVSVGRLPREIVQSPCGVSADSRGPSWATSGESFGDRARFCARLSGAPAAELPGCRAARRPGRILLFNSRRRSREIARETPWGNRARSLGVLAKSWE